MKSASPAPISEVDQGPVLLDRYDGGLAHIRLNRPESSNALNLELLQALHAVVAKLHGQSGVRTVVLTAEGPNFCAGGDVHTFLARGVELPAYVREATSYLQIVATMLIQLDAPVVSAVHGFAAGGGLGLLCSSDIVIAAESARICAGATRVGMGPDAGVSVSLTQLVGLRRAAELLLLNPVLSAVEAREIGLVTRVVPEGELRQAAFDVARKLADGAPVALAATKRLLWGGLARGVQAAMGEENAIQAQLAGTHDTLEGLAAMLEKRAPRFQGR